MVILCQLKDLNLSCFGCCGNTYSNKKKLLNDIKKSSKEFENKKSITQFMTRTKHLKESGICANLIFKNDKFYCPGHPTLHNGKDFRNLDPDCDKNFLCLTFSSFQTWDKKKQKEFLEFIKKKVSNGMDSHAYSINMDNGKLLKEFEKRY
ncbi:hypothetical protein ISS07_02530 [Candidatus Woesearchaeota archaeon]|nr:hypothetical protein [Candidatus Woesearchaeota archaeon]